MPPRRLRCKIKTANCLHAGRFFWFRFAISNRSYRTYMTYMTYYWSGRANRGLITGAELFDERYAIDFVQGRNPCENLLQGRFPQTLQPFGLCRAANPSTGAPPAQT